MQHYCFSKYKDNIEREWKIMEDKYIQDGKKVKDKTEEQKNSKLWLAISKSLLVLSILTTSSIFFCWKGTNRLLCISN